jgi:hypothetical protein
MRTRFGFRAAAAILTAALLVSCSGGSRLTKQELITQGDAICKTARDKAAPIGNNLGAPTQDNLPQYADAFGQLLPIFKDMVSKLKGLKPPEVDQRMWDQITSGLDQEAAAIQRAQQAAANGDLAGLKAAGQQIASVDTKASQIAAGYGFQECGGQTGGGSSPPPAAGS